MDKITAIETDLADLHGTGLDEVCQLALREALEPFCDTLITQVERPRPNVGTGPPGRAD